MNFLFCFSFLFFFCLTHNFSWFIQMQSLFEDSQEKMHSNLSVFRTATISKHTQKKTKKYTKMGKKNFQFGSKANETKFSNDRSPFSIPIWWFPMTTTKIVDNRHSHCGLIFVSKSKRKLFYRTAIIAFSHFSSIFLSLSVSIELAIRYLFSPFISICFSFFFLFQKQISRNCNFQKMFTIARH